MKVLPYAEGRVQLSGPELLQEDLKVLLLENAGIAVMVPVDTRRMDAVPDYLDYWMIQEELTFYGKERTRQRPGLLEDLKVLPYIEGRLQLCGT